MLAALLAHAGGGAALNAWVYLASSALAVLIAWIWLGDLYRFAAHRRQTGIEKLHSVGLVDPIQRRKDKNHTSYLFLHGVIILAAAGLVWIKVTLWDWDYTLVYFAICFYLLYVVARELVVALQKPGEGEAKLPQKNGELQRGY